MPVELAAAVPLADAGGREKPAHRRAVARFAAERRAYIDQVLAEIARRGPVTGGDFAPEGPRKSGWWEWSEGKTRAGVAVPRRPHHHEDPARRSSGSTT